LTRERKKERERSDKKIKEKEIQGWRKDVPFDGHYYCLWIANERDSEREWREREITHHSLPLSFPHNSFLWM
jgi:CRISPR/Cas system-associated protein Cas10 (large subunit of type III CRISPR-Cas system)